MNGIDLCLKCLNGGCVSSPNHSLKHYEQSLHPLVLNFKNILKKKASKENIPEKKEINRIAIGKEGGADFHPEDEYEIKTELKCLVCKLSLNNEPLKNFLDSVIKAETSYAKSGLVAWELEIKPCAHVKALVQDHQNILSSEGKKLI